MAETLVTITLVAAFTFFCNESATQHGTQRTQRVAVHSGLLIYTKIGLLFKLTSKVHTQDTLESTKHLALAKGILMVSD